MLNKPMTLLLALLAPACSGTVLHMRVPVGWHDSMASMQPCGGVSDPVVQLREGDYQAVAPGHTKIKCKDYRIDIQVHAIARLELEIPATLDHAKSQLVTLHAYDATGAELSLGPDPAIDWQLENPIRRAECSNKLWERAPDTPTCGPSDSLLVVGLGSGTGTITASFAGKTVKKTVQVQPSDPSTGKTPASPV
ncbi:MAG: hypothetical protein H6Q90_3665 [Deltaproteobacteria bacterium]|nr:hypothetical protein [Deltaproteobacteria bacterium]